MSFVYTVKGFNSKGQLMTTEHGYAQNQLDDVMWSMSEEFGYAEALDEVSSFWSWCFSLAPFRVCCCGGLDSHLTAHISVGG